MADEELDIRTYSLPEVAKMILPDMTSGVRWLSNRLNRGELSGYRVRRTWRMTREDVADVIERHRNRPLPRVDAQTSRSDLPSGLTPTSRRRPDRGNL
jgi:hypothetical protein